MQNKLSESGKYAINSPILNSVKLQSPTDVAEEEKLETPIETRRKFHKFNEAVETPENRPDAQAADKGAKSAANAELYAFY